MSLTVHVAFISAPSPVEWIVDIPPSLCASGRYSEIMSLVRAAAPSCVKLPAQLFFRTFTGAKWTVNNVSELARPNKNYICVSTEAQPAAVLRRTNKQLLPASGVLTNPLALPVAPEHLPAVAYISCEYFDNALKALRGVADPDKRKIVAHFQLSEPTNPRGKRFAAYLDYGSGMSAESMERWASSGTPPEDLSEVISLIGETPYFADGDLSKFGHGSKYAAFHLGNEVLCVSKPKDPSAGGQQQIYEMRLNKAVSDAADAQTGAAFTHPMCARPPRTDGGWRQEWEKNSPEFTELLKHVDGEPHFTLFVISDLNQMAVEQLTAQPFPALCKSLKGMYFYYTTRGAKGKPPRANFMHGTGYEDGPVQIQIRGTGFKRSDGTVNVNVQVHNLEDAPYGSWPEDPGECENREYEDGMHALARHTLHSRFSGILENCPEVCGSKFVLGAIIPGATSQGVKVDVFVKVYLHYLPLRGGRETKEDLGLKNNARWFTFWKGRMVVMSDINAVLPFMRRVSGRKTDFWSQAQFWKHANDQVVGQIFFPSTTTVDVYKFKFNEAINEQLEKLPDNYYSLNEDQFYQSEEKLSASTVSRGTPGVNRLAQDKMALRYRHWVKACHDTFDEQWIDEDIISQPADPIRKFTTLRRLGQQPTVYRQGTHVYIEHIGSKLSVYKDSLGKNEQRQSLFGAIMHFEMDKDGSFTSAKAVVSREPDTAFGVQHFAFPIHKLRLATEQELQDERAKAAQSLPKHFVVAVDGSQEEGPAMRPRPLTQEGPVTVLAKVPLKPNTVKLSNSLKGASRARREVTHWTQANSSNHEHVVPIVVEEVIEDSNGKTVCTCEGKLGEVEPGGEAFIVKETRSRMLPKPGEYTVQYVATVRNRGGQQYHHTLTSPAYHYRAVAGPVTDCGAHGWPDKVHLGTGLDSVYVELRDKAGNVARVAAVPPVSFSSDALTITYGAVQWEELAGSAPRLQLAGLVLEPTASFKASGAGTATQCGVELHVNLDKGPPLVNKFDISVYPGKPEGLRLIIPKHLCFSSVEGEPREAVENHSDCPSIKFQLQDIHHLDTCPQGNADRVVVKLQPALQGASLDCGEATFDVETGTATISKLCVHLPPMSKARTVTLQASVPGCKPRVPVVVFKALVKPSSTPCSMQLFTDEACTDAMSVKRCTDGIKYVMKQPAGEKVAPFYLQLDNEAKDLRELPAGVLVSMSGKTVDFSAVPDTAVIQVTPSTGFKVPPVGNSQDVPVLVSKKGRQPWECGATVQLTPTAGAGTQWAWNSSSRRQPVLEVKNGQNMCTLLQAYVRDKRDNALDSLPAGVNLPESPPELQVAPTQLEGPSQPTPAFWLNGQKDSSIYQGRWSFDADSCLLSMPDFALVGPPGLVTLTLAGGTGSQGQPLQSGSFQVQLTLGDLDRSRLGVSHWPSGQVSMRYEVRDLIVTAQDMCGNSLPPPADASFVMVETVTGSSASAQHVAASGAVAHQLPLLRQGGQIKVLPFVIVSTEPGIQQMRLRLCKNKRNPVDIAVCDLNPITVGRSSIVVSSIEVQAPADITAGSPLPSLLVQLRMEDRSLAEHMTGFYSNMTASCVSSAGQTVPMTLRPDPVDSSRLICKAAEPVACDLITTYTVTLVYQPPPSAGGTRVVKDMTVAVQSGLAHMPHLPQQAVTGRSCFNVGLPIHRTVIPAAILTLRDRFGNVAQLGSTQPQPVSISVTDSTGCSAGGQYPQLDIASVQGISMSPTDSKIQLGPVLASANAAATSGAFSLTIRVAGVPEPLVVPFTFTDAAGWSHEQQAAQQRKHEAQRRVDASTASLGAKRGAAAGAAQAVQRAMSGAERSLDISVTLDNWHHVVSHCQAELQRLPTPRPLHLRTQMLQHQQKAEISLIVGVIGFGYDLICVTADDDARLLSWYAHGSLESLYVRTWAAAEAVEAKWKEWGLVRGHQLTFVILEGLTPLHQDLQRQWLPHQGLRVDVTGNPRYFHSLVTLWQPVGEQPPVQQKQQIINYVCGRAILMDTDASAKQYQSTVKRLDQYCPDLVSLDKGSLVRSGGSYTIGPEACAPRSLHTMGLCVGAPRKELTQAYQGYSAALQSLQSMPQLVQTQSEAQAAEEAAEKELASHYRALREAEDACKAADQQMEQLQLHTPGATPPTDGNRPSTGRAPGAPAQCIRKRAASTREDSCTVSPTEPRRVQPRSDSLAPRRLLSRHD